MLAEGRVGRSAWPGVFERVRRQADLHPELPRAVLEWMLRRELLVEDGGIVWTGPTGEREYGARNFMDVTSLFLTEPLLAVRWGQRDLGSADPSSLASRDEMRPTILLGGRAWGVREVDWNRRVVWVEPVDEPGKSRWMGAGAALSIEICHALRRVLADGSAGGGWRTERASSKLAKLQEEHAWVRDGRTALVRDSERERSRWWTFGGARANAALAAALDSAGIATTALDDLSIGLRSPGRLDELAEVVADVEPEHADARVDPRRVEAVKFASCLPDAEVERMLQSRDRDAAGVATVISEPIVAAS